MYADAPADQIDLLISKKVDGIVIAGVGNGNFNKVYTDAVKRAVKAGIVVCRASRTPSGRVVLHDEVNDDELGTIVSDDLTPQKARVLLMLGLTRSKDQKALQEFSLNINHYLPDQLSKQCPRHYGAGVVNLKQVSKYKLKIK